MLETIGYWFSGDSGGWSIYFGILVIATCVVLVLLLMAVCYGFVWRWRQANMMRRLSDRILGKDSHSAERARRRSRIGSWED